jgi:effector-binding domain-containing protein
MALLRVYSRFTQGIYIGDISPGDVIKEYDGRFHFKRTEPFKCVSLIHEGSWQDLPRSYGTLMQFINKKHLKLAGVNREIYINADFASPDANITEVQIGVL